MIDVRPHRHGAIDLLHMAARRLDQIKTINQKLHHFPRGLTYCISIPPLSFSLPSLPHSVHFDPSDSL